MGHAGHLKQFFPLATYTKDLISTFLLPPKIMQMIKKLTNMQDVIFD